MHFTIGMAFIFISLLFSIGLNVLYFTKKHVKNYETRLFGIFLPSNLIGLLLELLCSLSIVFFGIESFISLCLSKLFLIYLLYFGLLLILYVYVVCGSQETVIELTDKQRQVRNIFIVIIIISSFITLMLPIELRNSNGAMYSSGLATIFVFGISGIAALYCIVRFILSINTLRKRKYFPLIIYVIGAGIATFIQNKFPEFTIATSMETFMIFLMYNTIENPDVKMLEQMELAKEQAEKANRAKTDFLSSMSHEIRTPLNAIVGFSDCIMEAKDLREAQENAKDIVNASQTLLEIVNGILDISKIEAGKLEIVNSKYNAPETFLELAKLITPKMNEKGLDFTYNIAPDLPTTLFGDHANLKKIVTNLLSNACKYTDKGFVHYEVSCVNTNDVSKLIISVEDSGRGIKKESVDKMFTKFQRLDEDRNTTIEGTGLGLAITKQLIELMGGKIIVHTVYGEGSKFTVVLNQKIESGELVETKRIKTTLDLHNVRILLVDDTPLNLKVACKLLEKYNADQIITCESGFQCIEKIQRGEVYDIILLDDMMPKMSGVETLKKLKELPNFTIPTIALTANAITGMREKYLEDGFNDYLAKPIEKEQLIQVLNQVLGRSVTEEIPHVVEKETPAVRSEEIPDVTSYERAEKERKNSIIPVEDNIEEVLGNQVERNYQEPDVVLNTEDVHVDHIEHVEEEHSVVDLIPLVDINVPTTSQKEVYDEHYLEENGVDMNHALELLGDMEMYNMTISDFSKEVEDKWSKIVEFKEQNNMPEYAILVHSLKSDCKYLGFMKLADICYQHELKSKENDSTFVMEHFSELEEEYSKALVIVKNYVESHE